MKTVRGCCIISIVLLVGLVLSSCQNKSHLSHPPTVQTIRVVMDNNYPPYVFLDNSGNLQGILVDQWRLWEQKTGVKVEIHAMNWGEALSRMKAGEFDVIDTIFYTEERAKLYDYTKPSARIDVPIFFDKKISGITSAESLKGFTVAVKSGDAAIDFLKSKGVDQLQEYDSYEAIIQAAKEQRVRVFVVDQPPALYFLYKMDLIDQFNTSQPLYTGEFHRAVKKGSTELLNLVEEGFGLISAGEYSAIESKWYGTELSRNFSTTIRYIGIVAGIILLVIIVLVSWNHLLRLRVRQKTQQLNREIEISKSQESRIQEQNEQLKDQNEELLAREEALVQAQGELRQLNASLEQRIRDRTAQLEAANQELEGFVYSVSHDLRAPLRSIDGFSGALMEDYPERLDAEGQTYLRNIHIASQHMAQLLEGLLELSRVSRSEMDIMPVNISKMAQIIKSVLAANGSERSVEWVIQPDLIVNADRALIQIVLCSLLDNAWKFTSKHPTAHIELGMLEKDGKPVYFIRDDGAGMDMTYADKLFGVFQRLHSSSEYEGAGIGLALAQRIIHRHGGKIWLESGVEQGTTVYFTLSSG